jgi:hypothetical protein
MMRMPLIACFLFATAQVMPAWGHGTPITIGTDGDRLVVTHEPPPDGYPPHIFVEEGVDGDPFASLTLPSVGPVVIWQVPGFEISGLDDQSSLSIEVLPRTVEDSESAEERILWYWNPETELVEAAPNTAGLYLLGTGMRYATLAPPDGAAPPPFTLADPVAGQQGFHNHGLLSYALDDSPAAAPGAYGFFARLTSNEYDPSDPFLIVLNYGVDYAQMVPAALAIDAAAVDPNAGSPLFGDYNGNGVVDAADYTAWRDAVASSASTLLNDPTPNAIDESDFLYWRAHYGESAGGGAAALIAGGALAKASLPVPEPAAWLLCAVAALASPIVGRQASGRSRRPA